jgi:hypothetical protein
MDATQKADLLKRYFDEHNKGLKEFNSMISSKLTQLRSERTKKLYVFFHQQILPRIETLDKKTFNNVCRVLSICYRNSKFDVDETIAKIPDIINEMESQTEVKEEKVDIPPLGISIESKMSPIKEEYPASPTNKNFELKKKSIAKKSIVKKEKVVKPKKTKKSQEEIISLLTQALQEARQNKIEKMEEADNEESEETQD